MQTIRPCGVLEAAGKPVLAAVSSAVLDCEASRIVYSQRELRVLAAVGGGNNYDRLQAVLRDSEDWKRDLSAAMWGGRRWRGSVFR